jgi:hypothetical protein
MAAQKPPKVSSSDFFVAFGPDDTYIARAPNDIHRSTLKISPELAGNLDAAKAVNFIIFPPASATFDDTSGGADDVSVSSKEEKASRKFSLKRSRNATPASGDPSDPYVSYSKKGHGQLSVPSGNYFPSLTDWLKERWGTGGLQVVGNGEAGWWGLSSSGTTKWTNKVSSWGRKQ